MSTFQKIPSPKSETPTEGRLGARADSKQIQVDNYTVPNAFTANSSIQKSEAAHRPSVSGEAHPLATWPALHKVRNGTTYPGHTLNKSYFAGSLGVASRVSFLQACALTANSPPQIDKYF